MAPHDAKLSAKSADSQLRYTLGATTRAVDDIVRAVAINDVETDETLSRLERAIDAEADIPTRAGLRLVSLDGRVDAHG